MNGVSASHRVSSPLGLALTAALVALPTIASADILDFIVTLDGTQENPPNSTTGFGSGTITLDTDTGELTWEISYSGLTGAATGAHFHGAADRCTNAGIVIGLDHTENPLIGSATVTPSQITEIREGLWYVNIHTAMFGPGEIRGQVEPAPIEDPIDPQIPRSAFEVDLVPVASGLTAPNWAASPRGDFGRLFVSDQMGILWNIDLETGEKSVFLDVSDQLVPLGILGEGTFDERGLLGFAFAPDYFTSGRLYTYTSQPVDGEADFSTIPDGFEAEHQTVITEWTVPLPQKLESVVDPESARELLRIDQPQFNHNGGCMNFGPDGMLYISLGDGGAADDRDGEFGFEGPAIGHGCIGNGQDLGSILGKVIRIDPTGSNSGNGQYGIPADNPFVGEPGVVEEVYAYGLRNPFRFSFDQVSGTMILGDVGQNHIEEVNIIESGGNYGWNWKEGTFRFVPNGVEAGYVVSPEFGVPEDLIDPIAQYDHDDGLSVIGGFVYRGSALGGLQGMYVFGEFARTFANDGRLLHLTSENEVVEFNIKGLDNVARFVLGMGQDRSGEIYVLANDTGVPFEETGVVLRVASALSLEVSGECPDAVTATATGVTRGGRVAFVIASGVGGVTVPTGPCAGTMLGLNATARLGAGPVRDANGDGIVSVTGSIPSGACGGNAFIQAVDLELCATSNVSPTP